MAKLLTDNIKFENDKVCILDLVQTTSFCIMFCIYFFWIMEVWWEVGVFAIVCCWFGDSMTSLLVRFLVFWPLYWCWKVVSGGWWVEFEYNVSSGPFLTMNFEFEQDPGPRPGPQLDNFKNVEWLRDGVRSRGTTAPRKSVRQIRPSKNGPIAPKITGEPWAKEVALLSFSFYLFCNHLG